MREKVFAGIPEGEVIPFVDGWDFVGVLGEGAFGEVRLVYNAQARLKAAVKIINLDGMDAEMKRTIDREVKLHKYLKHKNIIRHYGSRFHDPYNCQFIFMEYAEGGELFDRLCPDVGLPEHVAQNYFKQLISGVVFLHGKGVSHRDLKPENLLLTSDGKLKIIDFGNATVSINKDGTPKKMVKICGTPPYMAPELFTGSGYFGFQADVWACGCILVAMLAGELPWEKATGDNRDYCDWLARKHDRSPWPRISIEGLQFLRRILEADVEKRIILDHIPCSYWYNKKFEDDEAYSTHAKKRIKLNNSEAYSQPLNYTGEDGTAPDDEDDRDIEFIIPINPNAQSQPLDKDSIMILASQTQSQTQDPNSVRIPRITRLWFDTKVKPRDEIIEMIITKLDLFKAKEKLPKRCWRFTQIAGDSNALVFELSVFKFEEAKIMLDFRRAKGCGIKFKRVFRDLRRQLTQMEIKPPYLRKLILKTRDHDRCETDKTKLDEKENIPDEKKLVEKKLVEKDVQQGTASQ